MHDLAVESECGDVRIDIVEDHLDNNWMANLEELFGRNEYATIRDILCELASEVVGRLKSDLESV